jgi:hypothetical protein
MLLLRNLRAGVKAEAETELREDGTTTVSWKQVKEIGGKAGAPVELPPTIQVTIPMFMGDATHWQITVRLRASVDDKAHLTLRFSLVNADRAIDEAVGLRVEQARGLLGDGYVLLRRAG